MDKDLGRKIVVDLDNLFRSVLKRQQSAWQSMVK
jgi:hypothetical protein